LVLKTKKIRIEFSKSMIIIGKFLCRQEVFVDVWNMQNVTEVQRFG